MSSCELDASGSPGTAPYWKFLDLFVYSVGPFLATFLGNTAIILRIYRARLLQRQFVNSPRVRFLKNSNCSVEEKSADASKVEKEVAFVEHLACNRSESDEIRESFGEPPVPLREQLIKDDTSSNRKFPPNQSSTKNIIELLV